MLHFPRPSGYPFHPHRTHEFALVCHVCLKTWAVCGMGENGFIIERVACPECAYTQAAWNITGGPAWWRIESSILDCLQGSILEHLAGKPAGIRDMLNVLPPAVIQHEFRVHLAAFDYFSRENS